MCLATFLYVSVQKKVVFGRSRKALYLSDNIFSIGDYIGQNLL